MSINLPVRGLRQARHAASYSQLCSSLRYLQLSNPRTFSTSNYTYSVNDTIVRARERIAQREKDQQDKAQSGGLAEGSIFSEELYKPDRPKAHPHEPPEKFRRLPERNMESLSMALNPRPKARSLWLRKMTMRHVRRRGRLTRAESLARTERTHLSKSHFMKTSIKKMMMLARQIAGKSIDEAILQMRFSKKRVAQQVLEQLVVARNEAIVKKGMGLGQQTVEREKAGLERTLPTGPLVENPGITPPVPHQTPTKTLKKGEEAAETDIYIAQSWINRGPYGKLPDYRARGRMNIKRPPHTGISVLLKEEKTRTREKAEKEARAIRRRLGKGAWTQLPDRPVTRQSQHVLW